MNAQLPTPEETRPSSPKRSDTICKNETRQNIYEGVESMYKNYCDDDWDDESESEYYVQDFRIPNDDDPPSGSVNENDADLRLFEQTYDISSHVAHSNWNRLYCDYNSLDYY